jgi:type I restriction enzyme S subunit
MRERQQWQFLWLNTRHWWVLISTVNDNLQQQAYALYKSWFVDFSSVSNNEMIDSQIGKIPYGWRVYKLSEFLPVITGKKNANVSSDKGGYPFFSCSQDFSWTDDYSFEGHAILVAGNGDFNVKWYKGKFEAYQRTYVLIPYEERFTSWLYYAVKYNLAKITSAARGSVIKFITKGNLEDFAFAAPADLSSCAIIDTFATINRKIDALTQENYRLAAMRDTLLPKLMRGEIDVSDIEI